MSKIIYNEDAAQQLFKAGKIEELAEMCMTLVDVQVGLDKKKLNRNLDFEDLYSAYLIALTRALQSYNPDKGTQLKTWIYTFFNGYKRNWLKRGAFDLLDNCQQLDAFIEETLIFTQPEEE